MEYNTKTKKSQVLITETPFSPMPQEFLEGKITYEQLVALQQDNAPLRKKQLLLLLRYLEKAAEKNKGDCGNILERVRSLFNEVKTGVVTEVSCRPCGVPDILMSPCHNERKKAKRRMSPLEIFPKFASQMISGHITDNGVIYAYQRQLKRAAVLAKISPHRSITFFYGSVRGNKKYSALQADKIQYITNQLNKSATQVLFFTFTVNNKLYDNSPFVAWSHLPEIRNRILRELRLQLTGQYIWVAESTNKGFPHLHLLWFKTGEPFKTFTDKKGNLRIASREKWQELKNANPTAHTDIKVVVDNKIERYLQKYITKGMSDCDLMSAMEGDLTKENRKLMLSVMCPIVAQRRTWGYSSKISLPAPYWAPIPLSAFLSQSKKEIMEKMAPIAENPLALIKLLNNWTNAHNTKIYAIDRYKFHNLSPPIPENTEIFDLPTVLWAHKEGKKLSCNSCWFCSFLSLLSEQEKEEIITVISNNNKTANDKSVDLFTM